MDLVVNFLDTTPKPQSMKETIDKLSFIKIKNLWSEKDTVKKIKRQTAIWEEIFAKHMSDEGRVSKIYRVVQSLLFKSQLWYIVLGVSETASQKVAAAGKMVT